MFTNGGFCLAWNTARSLKAVVVASGPSETRCHSAVLPAVGHHLGIKMVIKVYVASSTSSIAVKKHQQAVVGFLEANRITFQEVDITMLEERRLWMYRNIPEEKRPEKGNPLPPQIFNEDRYCGDYEDFFLSKENDTVFAFLGLRPQPSVKDSES